MALTETPAGQIGMIAPDFALKGTDEKIWTRDECTAKNGLVVMFICNHCPYVKAIQSRLVEDASELIRMGVGVVAINANDAQAYEEDSLENMKLISQLVGYPFPYLIDESQSIAKAYGAVCTPDIFAFDKSLKLKYRGRLDESGRNPPSKNMKHELIEAMELIISTGEGPENQVPSIGCSIKWKADNISE